MKERKRWRIRGSDGERGIEKHLPSLLESRAVITELRHSKREGGKENHTQCTFSNRKGEDERYTSEVMTP